MISAVDFPYGNIANLIPMPTSFGTSTLDNVAHRILKDIEGHYGKGSGLHWQDLDLRLNMSARGGSNPSTRYQLLSW
eukprot:4213301-Amphidinium_carterae.1